MAIMDYSTIWEAFVGGAGWGNESPGVLTADNVENDAEYAERVESFYNKVIGPAFGYERTGYASGQEFGTAFQTEQGEALFGVGEERDVLDLAEREFRVSIGDPYAEASDPFSWENISRYGIDEYEVSEAQKMMEDKLYGKGFLLGGETGSEYGLSMEKQGETYTSGLAGQREGLTYEGLTGVAGLASGTSGSVLRSGQASLQAEDVLVRAYEESKGLGTAYVEGKEKTELELETDLDDALGTYMDIIEEQKQGFLDNILKDVQIWKGVTDIEGLFGSADVQAEFAEQMADVQGGWGTLEYGDKPGGFEAYDFRADGACDIGELFVDGMCQPIEGLKRNEYGELIGSGEGFEGLYDCAGKFEGGKVVDECGVCGGDNACVDDCGVVNGDNECTKDYGCGPGEGPPSFTCPTDGSIECGPSDCPEEKMVEEECDWETQVMDYATGQCVPKEDTGEWDAGTVLCDDNSVADAGPWNNLYKNCPTYEEGGYCPCVRAVSAKIKGSSAKSFYNCPGNSLDGMQCSHGTGGGMKDKPGDNGEWGDF